ncbi:PP2C family protein-serine/threonine phosphatase [Agromyces sp. MMS24-K17]|uniref:PP2C family protein-serine/threonine phosphatase n=1 Tax=Agromyces sp. MMS24-K17 TaxID=3372850 RepID=UPI0037549C05
MSGAVMQLAWGAATDRGRKRRENEDSYVARPPVFFVADGMGGHEAGAHASAAAISAIGALAGRPSVSLQDLEVAFAAAVDGVRAIRSERAAPGTTITGVAVSEQGGGGYWLVMNIGDSRTYLRSSGRTTQVSVDHSAVQALIDSGAIGPEEAATHPERSVITRAVGAGSEAQPDFWMLPALRGDRLLACSDGLTKELDAERIDRALAEERDPQAAADRLVAEALAHGGRDNITVVVVDAVGVAADDDDPTLPTGIHAVDDDTRPRSELLEGA